MAEDLNSPPEGLIEEPLRSYLLEGTPLKPEYVIELGYQAGILAHRMDFAERDLEVDKLADAMSIRTRIVKMKRFAARALLIADAAPRPQEYVVPAHKSTGRQKSKKI